MKDVWWLTSSILLATINCQVLDPNLDQVKDELEVEERLILEQLPISQLDQLKLQLEQEEDPRRRTFPGAGRLTSYVRGVLQNVQGLLQAPVRGMFRPPLRGISRPQKKPLAKPHSTTKPESPQPTESLPENEEHQIFQVAISDYLSLNCYRPYVNLCCLGCCTSFLQQSG